MRVTYPGENGRTGTLVALSADTLSVQWENSADTARMARGRVTRFGVSRGMRQGDRGARAKIGFVVGAGAVILIDEVNSNGSKSNGGLEDLADGFATIFGALLAGGVGALVGAATGGPSETWEDVRLAQPQIGVVLPTRSHGAGLGLRLAF